MKDEFNQPINGKRSKLKKKRKLRHEGKKDFEYTL